MTLVNGPYNVYETNGYCSTMHSSDLEALEDYSGILRIVLATSIVSGKPVVYVPFRTTDGKWDWSIEKTVLNS